MMAALPPDAAAKLSKICGLLASSHDGERSAAAYKATQLLQSHGLTWSDVIAPARPASTLPPRPQSHGPVHVAVARAALQHAGHLTNWEVAFLQSIARQRRLSLRQEATLTGIVQKLRMGGAA